jgi:hypothetical protein
VPAIVELVDRCHCARPCNGQVGGDCQRPSAVAVPGRVSWPNILMRRDSGQTGRRIAPHGTDTRLRLRGSMVQSDSSPFPPQADEDLAHPSCGYFWLPTQLRGNLFDTNLERMCIFGQHGRDLVLALPRELCYPFLKNPQLQIATPPPPTDRVVAAGHLHRSSRQPNILISQLVICQCVYRRTHRLPDGEFITSTHHKPPHRGFCLHHTVCQVWCQWYIGTIRHTLFVSRPRKN